MWPRESGEIDGSLGFLSEEAANQGGPTGSGPIDRVHQP